MPVNRFFRSGPLYLEETVEFKNEEAKHMTRVLRLTPGEEVEITNGKGLLAKGNILSVTKQSVSVSITHLEQIPLPSYEIHLWQSLIRPSKLDLIVEKGTELGITHFHFFHAENSEKTTLSENQKTRLQYLAISGCKQSGRVFIPHFDFSASYTQINEGFFGDVAPNAPHILVMNKRQKLHFINGPESGFSKAEQEKLRAKGIQGVSLSDAVLRTETAAIAAATFLNALCHIDTGNKTASK